MIVARNNPFGKGADMEAALAHALRLQSVRSLADLMDYVAADGDTVRRHLSSRLERGEAEEIRPVAEHPDERSVFFRWRSPGEEAFQSQQQFFEGTRMSRGFRWYDGKPIED